eukprot:2361967-Pleurochrysis_carterae.AAC.1
MGRERQGAYECEVQCRRKVLSFLEGAAIHVRQTRPRLNTESLLSRLFGAMNAEEYILAILAEYRYIRYSAFRGRYRYPVGVFPPTVYAIKCAGTLMLLLYTDI